MTPQEAHQALTDSDRKIIHEGFFRSILNLEMPEEWEDDDLPVSQLLDPSTKGLRKEVWVYWRTLREFAFNQLQSPK